MAQVESQHQPASAQPATAQPQREKRSGSNVYTWMLVLTFLALAGASLIMYFHLTDQFGNYPWWSTSEVRSGSGTTFNTSIVPPAILEPVETALRYTVSSTTSNV